MYLLVSSSAGIVIGNTNLLLTKYALERVLYRIGQLSDKNDLVLKGALLFELWTEQTHRPTRDADFLFQGENSRERFQKILEEICALKVEDDGLRFDATSVEVERIKEDRVGGMGIRHRKVLRSHDGRVRYRMVFSRRR